MNTDVETVNRFASAPHRWLTPTCVHQDSKPTMLSAPAGSGANITGAAFACSARVIGGHPSGSFVLHLDSCYGASFIDYRTRAGVRVGHDPVRSHHQGHAPRSALRGRRAEARPARGA